MKNLVEERMTFKKKMLTWTEPELIELNAHLRDIAEGYCSIGNAVVCVGGTGFNFSEQCDGGSIHTGG